MPLRKCCVLIAAVEAFQKASHAFCTVTWVFCISFRRYSQKCHLSKGGICHEIQNFTISRSFAFALDDGF